MTSQQRKEVARYLEAFDFSGLFTDPAIGWNWPDSGKALRVPFSDGFIDLQHIAEKRGVRILLVPPMADGGIMPSDDRKKLEKAVTPLAAEHLLIFANRAKTRQIWLWTSRFPGKPIRPRELTWEKGRANENILQKLTSIAFTLDEEEGLDITGVVQRLCDSLDRDRLTRRFYDDFKRHKDQFQKFIKGITDSGILAHYTSLMLNRLMFCYFLQQKGFLNGEQDYLRKRLDTVPATLGKNKFHSFYRSFLKRLFFDGLDNAARPAELVALIGENIPYLNGGIFAEHPIERAHPGIVIPDDAFKKIFDFFDNWHWHLDDRPLGNDREINPEVLGYVFEKYTNQKEMGAYYTKEDITEYIGKNTILPFLLQKVADKLNGSAGVPPASSMKIGQDGHALGQSTVNASLWNLLKDDPDRYIYHAVRHGAGTDEKAWKKSLPANIAIGLEGSAGILPASPESGRDARAPFYSPDAETLISRHKLPHWNQDDCYCFVTWRLDDSLPAELLGSLKDERELWLSRHPEPWDETTEAEFHRKFSDRLDEWLDAGHGECLLKEERIRTIVEDALHHFDGERYQLAGYVVMPNHVHVLLRLVAAYPLAEVLHSWKSFTAKAINKALGRKGILWQAEYWDRLIRSEQHFEFCLDYIRKNPEKAKLKPGTSSVFIRGAAGCLEGSVGILPAPHEGGRDARAPLIERRKDWNTSAPESHGLPTEIWRETIARHQRCHELRRQLRAGEVKTPADLVTLNLDIRQFAQDIIDRAPADLALALWKALRALSTLDPTCGSGAFLFAALEILVPLYEGLLDRFRILLADWKATGEKHPIWEKEIGKILDQVATHPNESYFIHKTIIVHNLYGVDIMEEAVEICKLRLFLKLAAQLEPGQAIEPLPDIDFNVRAGNTLVGYASRDEIKRAFSEASGSGQILLQGIENSLDDYTRIMEEAEDADRAFQRFQALQDSTGQNAADFRTAKETLENRLQSLRSQLDRFLAGQYDMKLLERGRPARNSGKSGQDARAPFQQWRDSHQPFHWFVEFYGIMNRGGFDVIVGNPPWLEYSKAKKTYTVIGYKTTASGNLYCLCTERCINLTSETSWVSFIVQLPIVSSSRMISIRDVMESNAASIHTITCDDRPGKLFEGLQNCRSTIFLLRRSDKAKVVELMTSGYRRWASSVRDNVFSTTSFAEFGSDSSILNSQFPKLASPLQKSVYTKVSGRANRPIGLFATETNQNDFVFYQESARYWVKATVGLPYYAKNKQVGAPAHGRYLRFKDARAARVGCAVLNSSLFYTWFIAYGDCFHVSHALATSIPVPEAIFSDKRLEKTGDDLMHDLKRNAERKTINTKDGDTIAYDEFRLSASKPIIDQIDTLLAAHYGFTEEELDYILNYDIKYRMGLGGGEEPEE